MRVIALKSLDAGEHQLVAVCLERYLATQADDLKKLRSNMCMVIVQDRFLNPVVTMVAPQDYQELWDPANNIHTLDFGKFVSVHEVVGRWTLPEEEINQWEIVLNIPDPVA